MRTTFHSIFMKRLSALRIEAGSGEAHAPALNSVSISRADPITPLVAPLKGLPFSIPRCYMCYSCIHRGKMKRSLVSAATIHQYRVCIGNVEPIRSVQNTISKLPSKLIVNRHRQSVLCVNYSSFQPFLNSPISFRLIKFLLEDK